MWYAMFNLVKLAFNPFGAAWAAYGQIRPEIAGFEAFRDPTEFKQCSTHLGRPERPLANEDVLDRKKRPFLGNNFFP